MTTAFEFSADFPTKHFKLTKLPYLASMRAFYLLGTDAASSLVNRVPGSSSPIATETGTPTYSTGYATVNGTTNRINGGFNSTTNPFTLIVVMNVPHTAGDAGCPVGYFTNIALPNFSSALTWDGTGQMYGNVQQPGPLNYRANLGGFTFNPGATKFAFFALTHDGTNLKIYGHSGKRLGVGTTATGSAAVAGLPFVIGGNYGTGTSFNVAAVGAADSAFTPEQLLKQYAYLKKVCPARGVPML